MTKKAAGRLRWCLPGFLQNEWKHAFQMLTC